MKTGAGNITQACGLLVQPPGQKTLFPSPCLDGSLARGIRNSPGDPT